MWHDETPGPPAAEHHASTEGSRITFDTWASFMDETAAPPTAPAAPPTAPASEVFPQTTPTGPPAPHHSVPAPPSGTALASRRHATGAQVWWLGVHGGAGESTMAALMAHSRAAERAWPDVDHEPAAVVLVARPSAHGLQRAQAAAAQWAAGATPEVRLLGLVLIADAPGRTPTPLHTLTKVIAGGVPRLWQLPWSEPLRLGEPPSSLRPPRPLRRLLRNLEVLTSPIPSSSPALEEVPHASHAAARI